jgi:DNA polymerase III gamma/tau subunit
MIDFDLTNAALVKSLGKFNTATLQEIDTLHLYDFGVYLDLEPEEEEKAMLEQNIQMALQQQQIYLEDAIDIREIKNLTLANQVLKYKRKQKQEQEQAKQQQNIEAQSQANIQASEQASMNDVQKAEAIASTETQIEQSKSQFEIQRMESQNQLQLQIMAQQFEYDMKLKQMDVENAKKKEGEIEDRKDKRTEMQASQQSKLIEQRQNDLPPTDFESNDSMELPMLS